MSNEVEKWQRAWRDGVCLHISKAGLESLRDALLSDAPELLQGATCYPPPLSLCKGYKVEGACAISYCGWKGDTHENVGDLEEYFQAVCYAADTTLGEPTACRYFIEWFDATPRKVMRRELLPEVELALQGR